MKILSHPHLCDIRRDGMNKEKETECVHTSDMQLLKKWKKMLLKWWKKGKENERTMHTLL
jgi:hypothetical protein